ncbi:MAG: hypothetical protein ABEJ04_03390 [Halobacteriaceae archaeon]
MLSDRLARLARKAGREYASARRAYREGREGEGASGGQGRGDGVAPDLPRDDAGRAKLVCRRYADRRAVELDGTVPACHEADHPACEGCLEDLREGRVETWE